MPCNPGPIGSGNIPEGGRRRSATASRCWRPGAERPPRRRRLGRTLPGAVLLAVVMLPSACRNESPHRAGVIDRETFVATYVELRAAALASPGGRITPEQRTRVLSERDVGEEDLLRFVEVHGRDVDYMARVWDEVQERVERRRAEGDPAP